MIINYNCNEDKLKSKPFSSIQTRRLLLFDKKYFKATKKYIYLVG